MCTRAVGLLALVSVPLIKGDVFVPQSQAASARSTATVQVCSGSINLRGAVKCRAYIHSNKPKVKEAIQVLSRLLVQQKHPSEIGGTWHAGFALPRWSKLDCFTNHPCGVTLSLLEDLCAVGKAELWGVFAQIVKGIVL